MGNISKDGMERITEDGIDIFIADESGRKEISANSVMTDKLSFDDSVKNIAGKLKELDAAILSMNIYGNTASYAECMDSINNEFDNVDFPVAFINGCNCFTGGIAGFNIQALSGTDINSIELDNRIVGRSYEDDSAYYCLLGNVHSEDTDRSRDHQTLQILTGIESALKKTGMKMTDIVRTWFYNSDILDWYDDFNYVRTRFYGEKNVFNGLLPASTGIGGYNPDNSALVAGVLAIKKKNGALEVEMLPSPLQCPAYDYGSSFSRAIEIKFKDHRRISVSGTASIDPDGTTAHIGDADSQIKLTLEVVEAILKSRAADFSDITRANAYFKVAEDAALMKKYIREYNMPESTIIISKNDVCRQDLLFEIELDAVLLNI
ncbi:MAG: translation initiation inhibitor [bacterium]|nr:translation initiation inhibitor [bacterium]